MRDILICAALGLGIGALIGLLRLPSIAPAGFAGVVAIVGLYIGYWLTS